MSNKMKREKCEIRIPRSFKRSHFLQLPLSPRRHGKFAYQIHAKFSSHRVGGNCVFETRLSSCRSIKRIRDWRRSGAKESCTCSFLGFLFLPPSNPQFYHPRKQPRCIKLATKTNRDTKYGKL